MASGSDDEGEDDLHNWSMEETRRFVEALMKLSQVSSGDAEDMKICTSGSTKVDEDLNINEVNVTLS